MPRVTPGRVAALAVLRRVAGGELLDRAFAAEVEGLEARERAWMHELVYGVVRLRGRLDHYLAAFARRGLEQLDPVVLDVLRLGSYQLLEMGSVPSYAAVSQSVDLVREAGSRGAGGFVNGVLQSLRRGWKEVAFPPFADAPLDHLSTWGSHPRWLVERWIARWGPEATRKLIEANNTRPELFIRPAGVSVGQALETLGRSGVDAEAVPDFPDSIRIVSGAPAAAVAAVPSVVQDPAAAMVVRFAAFGGQPLVLDLSAAPGGKTVGLASGGSRVVAADISLGRMRRVRANADGAGLADRVGLVVADGRSPPFRSARAILLDAPCTGTGTFRRHPDGRWRVTPADMEALVGLQRELLSSAVSLLEIGGTLVYSTCSLEPEENEMQVAWLLGRHPGLRRAAPGSVGEEVMSESGDLHILPQKHGVDGAFAARVERFE